ncbi:pro-interleukin-16 [Hypomesus transpacificus]|uniref:pro-interleukin-16 n=1 Tax=Hypomesus transpacificus TaxID=137520 RepID=UPI001F0745CE|nr:pro-interleukin-16 [Hypomesus transpacificus]
MGREGEGVGERTGSPACRRDLEKEATSTSEPAGVNLGSKLLSTNQMNSRATPDPSTRTLACVRSMAHEESMTEDVFEPSPQRSTAQPSDRRMLVVPSVASVKNKIQQFETLTQKNQRDFQRPRRAFSVPEHLGRKAGEGASKAGRERPIRLQGRSRRKEAASIKLLNFNNNSNSTEIAELQHSPSPDLSSSVSDNDKTPTNTPQDSPFYPQDDSPFHPQEDSPFHPQEDSPFHPQDDSPFHPQEDSPFHPQEDSPFYPGGGSPAFTPPAQPHTSSQETNSHLLRGSLVPPLPLSSPSSLPHTGGDLDAWVAGLNRKIERWDCDEEDDEGTEKDEDSNYDSDESSVTITSNMSQSDRRSFCLSLAELCNFGGVDYETEPEMEDWPPGRSASLSSDVSALSCVSVLDSEELDRLLDDVRSLGDDTLQNYEDVQVVVLHKEVGIGLGFTVAGGEDQNKPVTVHRVFSSGVAALEGSIREGDLVLSINGTSLSGSAHWQALRTLRKARTLGMGVVVLRRGVASKPVKGLTGADMQGRKQTPSTNTGQRLCVRLEKGSRDLGFTLEGGLGCSLGDRPLSVQKIFLGGPVNKVCPGDEVLEIQGVSVVGMRRLEAWTLIRRLPPGPVDVLLHRPLNTSHIHSQSL